MTILDKKNMQEIEKKAKRNENMKENTVNEDTDIY